MLTGLFSFQKVPEKKSAFNGLWDAEWQMINTAASGKSINHQMNGFMRFDGDGEVKITIYGYQGCIFSSDTIHNELQYKVQNDSLTIFNDQDQFQLSYLIESMSGNEIRLQLMEDIGVTLKKQQNKE